MQLLPLIPEFLIFKCEGKTCLSHSFSSTIIYIQLSGEGPDEIPEDIAGVAEPFQDQDISFPFSNEFFMMAISTDKDEEELDEIFKKATKWYIEYTAFGVFEKENARIMKEKGF